MLTICIVLGSLYEDEEEEQNYCDVEQDRGYILSAMHASGCFDNDFMMLQLSFAMTSAHFDDSEL